MMVVLAGLTQPALHSGRRDSGPAFARMSFDEDLRRVARCLAGAKHAECV
jgi:hypothetical protein